MQIAPCSGNASAATVVVVVVVVIAVANVNLTNAMQLESAKTATFVKILKKQGHRLNIEYGYENKIAIRIFLQACKIGDILEMNKCRKTS